MYDEYEPLDNCYCVYCKTESLSIKIYQTIYGCSKCLLYYSIDQDPITLIGIHIAYDYHNVKGFSYFENLNKTIYFGNQEIIDVVNNFYPKDEEELMNMLFNLRDNMEFL